MIKWGLADIPVLLNLGTMFNVGKRFRKVDFFQIVTSKKRSQENNSIVDRLFSVTGDKL